MAYVVPMAEVLVAEARRIVETNLALAPSVPGRVMSPIWERKGSRAAVRAVRLPGEFARRYFTGGGHMVDPGGEGLAAHLPRAILGTRWPAITSECTRLRLPGPRPPCTILSCPSRPRAVARPRRG